MTIDLLLTAVLWGCVIAMLISLHKLGTILDRMIERTSIIRLNISEVKDMLQTKMNQEDREKAIDNFIDELNNDEVLIMIIDGAGHGVPGSFVTMLVKAIQTQIISDVKNGKIEASPALILSIFNTNIKTMLKQEKGTFSQGNKSNARFDGGILYYNKNTKVYTTEF